MTSKKCVIVCIFYIVLLSYIVSAHPLTDLIVDNLCVIFNVIAMITGLIAVLMLTLAGIQWVGSEIDPQARQKAKERIVNVMIGLILVLVAIGIVYAVTGETPCSWSI